jgi:hypothetical protein
MTSFTQKLSKPILALALFLVVLVTNTPSKTVATDEQVAFTATGTGLVTSVTQLPGGLTQVNFTTSGKATHLGDFTGPLTRIQDHQGTFGSTAVIVGANGKDTIFLSVSGRFERSKDNCVATSTGIYTVSGVGGAFDNATGSGTIETQIDLCAGTAKGAYTGTISKPHTD